MTYSVVDVRHRLRNSETHIIIRIQSLTNNEVMVRGAKALSFVGEHAAGWIIVGLAGAVVDCPQRRRWLAATGSVVAAHAAAIGIKRVVRRPRPNDDRIEIRVGTPSRLSFPSSHATSTTAAAVAFAGLVGGRRVTYWIVPLMGASRVLLGVHFPTDVLAGMAVGAVIGSIGSKVAS